MRVRGGQVGVMLVEAPGGETRVSLRCRPPLNVLRVAQRFGGGGHHRAAGFRIQASLEEAEARVLEALRAVLPEPPP
jgi:phosphoesterase RecJ-like protein